MADEIVTIGGLDLTIPDCWVLIDPTPLLGEAPMRGEDRVVPGRAGRAHRPRRRDALDVVLEMYVHGIRDHTGTAHADRRLGLRDNIRKLRADLLPPYTDDEPLDIVHTFSDESTAEGTCIVNELTVVGAHDHLRGNVASVLLDVTVLEGVLEEPSE